MEIQEALAAAQITTFTEVLEKVQRVEIAMGQVKAFQARKRSASSSEPEELKDTVPPSKARRVNLPPYPPWMQGQYEGSSTRESQVGRGRQEEVSLKNPIEAPRLACGYCGKTNHTEDACWVKGKKCLICGSADHQLHNCPKKQQRGLNV